MGGRLGAGGGFEGGGRFGMVLADSGWEESVGLLAGESSLTVKCLADPATVRGACQERHRAPEVGLGTDR